MSVQPTDDTYEMCRRIMYVLLHEINLQPQTIEFNKDVVWEAASSIPGVFKEYGLGLKDTVFQALVQQQDIVDLGETVRITGLFVRDRSLLR
jgi:adenine deaminase